MSHHKPESERTRDDSGKKRSTNTVFSSAEWALLEQLKRIKQMPTFSATIRAIVRSEAERAGIHLPGPVFMREVAPGENAAAEPMSPAVEGDA